MERQTVTRKMSVSEGIFLFLVLLMMVLLLKNSQMAIDSINNGLNLCVNTMIPSLFPFMVVADLIVRSGVGEQLSRPFHKVMHLLFDVGESGSCALLLGWFCGFPIGSRVARNYYECGKLSLPELRHLICFCNIPSTAFAVGAVGAAIFSSRRIGWFLFLASLLSAMVTGILFRWILPGRTPIKHMASNHTSQNSLIENKTCMRLFRGGIGFSSLSDSLRSATQSILQICATVLLFSALTGCLIPLFEHFPISQTAESLVLGGFEMTTGICRASAVSNTRVALYLCAAIMGWAGMSVHCQILSLCDRVQISLGWFWLSRGIQSLLNVAWIGLFDLLGWIVLPPSVLPMDLSAGKIDITFLGETDGEWYHGIVGILIFLLSIGVLLASFQHSRRSRKSKALNIGQISCKYGTQGSQEGSTGEERKP